MNHGYTQTVLGAHTYRPFLPAALQVEDEQDPRVLAGLTPYDQLPAQHSEEPTTAAPAAAAAAGGGGNPQGEMNGVDHDPCGVMTELLYCR